ncbi:MAG TPA: hypothetical protein VNF75_09010 [Candidatus Dormibacteraeota bacterium]|nr:hypothetical protein [Candidatus Dormibacteraeota bacterium]
MRPSAVSGWLSGLALLALAVAVCAGVVEALTSGPSSPIMGRSGRTRLSQRSWWGAAALTTAINVAVVQMWFRPGGAIAFGDVGPPLGVAWIGHLFAPWWGTGSSLGAPNGAETLLPWAGLLAATHAVGISAAAAENTWLSVLLAGAALAALLLQRQLGIEPVPAIFGALVYVLTPLVVSEGWSPLYFACMLLLAAGPALVLAVAGGRMRILHGVVALAAAAPLVGYVYISPPLCGLVLATIPGAALLALWLDGRPAGRRAGLLIAIGFPALLVTSLYWVLPSALQLSIVAIHQLSALTSWTWTESRATVRNAFWLNTTWTWAYSLYDSYAPNYRHLPLSVIRFTPALLAFGALLVRGGRAGRTGHALRTTLAFAGASLAVIFLSTGTLPPGSVLFDLLYRLPLGWLLQDPGRFLLVADLGYAVLCALSLQALVRSPGLRRWFGASGHGSLRLAAGTAVLTALVVLPAYPLLTGAFVPGPQQGYPSSHVNVPGYWPATARFVNTQAPHGTLLLLPVDDFYQMPYRWYYGNDGFITNLIARSVLDPVGQGATPAASPLLDAVTLAQRALLARNWSASRDVLGALGVRLLLVRGDLILPFSGHSFANPASVAAALDRDPFARLLTVRGPLRLYEVSTPSAPVTPGYATTNVPSPDLRDLSVLPPGYRLVSSRPIPGVPAITQFPALATWSPETRSLTTSAVVPPGHQAVALLTPTGAGSPTPIAPGGGPRPSGPVRVTLAQSGSVSRIRLQIELGASLLTDGNFSSGAWGSVGNCHAVPETQLAAHVHAALVPGQGTAGGSALQLSASADSACEVRALTWVSGPLLLEMHVRHVAGAPTRICLWEIPIARCAALPALPSGTGWQDYVATVTPAPGTQSLAIILYADGLGSGQRTVDDYANIRAVSLMGVPTPVIVTWPARPYRGPLLSTNGQSYSSAWRSLDPATHVVVDGLINGWLAASPVRSTYSPAAEVRVAEDASAVGAALLVLSLAADGLATRRRRRRSSLAAAPQLPQHGRPLGPH